MTCSDNNAVIDEKMRSIGGPEVIVKDMNDYE